MNVVNCALMSQGPEAVSRAIALAADVHSNQVDKGDQPYILHPIRVMEDAMKNSHDLWIVGIVAVLHDTLEDTEKYTVEGLMQTIHELFGERVLRMVELLTKRPDEDYFTYIDRILNHEDGTEDTSVERIWCIQIKLADLRDNMTILRQPTLTDKDMLRIQKYHMAYRMLDGRYGSWNL